MNSPEKQQPPFSLRSIRGFHIGGHAVDVQGLPTGRIQSVPGVAPRLSDPNGRYMVGQLYAQHVALAQPRCSLPMLLWHGGGMTGSTWEQTPDGRAGWQEYFMRWGLDTCVSDAVDRGRASWAPPSIKHEAPEHRTIEQAWSIFRLGAAGGYAVDPHRRNAYTGQRFPLNALDQLGRQFVARWSTSRDATLAAYTALVEQMGRSIILAHSEGARHAMEVAALAPQHIAAVILIEPAGAPAPDPRAAKALATIPHLVVWGDYFDVSELWSSYRARCDLWAGAVREAGGCVEELDLPAQGIKGNSHLLMMDDNSEQIAGLIAAWLQRTLDI